MTQIQLDPSDCQGIPEAVEYKFYGSTSPKPVTLFSCSRVEIEFYSDEIYTSTGFSIRYTSGELRFIFNTRCNDIPHSFDFQILAGFIFGLSTLRNSTSVYRIKICFEFVQSILTNSVVVHGRTAASKRIMVARSYQ